MALTLAERFHKSVDRSGGPNACWPWTKSCTRFKTTKSGALFNYGQIGGTVDGKRYAYLTHRLAYELANNVKLTPDQCVLHRCDNPPCCNPAHLFLGDRKANSDDKVAKGRHRYETHRGADHGNAKLTDDLVREMRAEYARGGIGQVPLSKKYGISQATCWAILHRRTWAHVP